MKKIWPVISIISIIFNIFLLYFFIIKGNVVPDSHDHRIAIGITSNNREFVLKEMRTFLETIHEINIGLTEDDPQKIGDAARKVGHETVEDAPPGLMATLPLGFKKMGLNTHDKFDELAAAVQKNYDKKEVQEKLTGILNNCTSCHKTYKFSTSK